MIRAIDIKSGKFTTHEHDEERYGNQLYTTFKVSKDVPLKNILPRSYTESLFYLKGRRVLD